MFFAAEDNFSSMPALLCLSARAVAPYLLYAIQARTQKQLTDDGKLNCECQQKF